MRRWETLDAGALTDFWQICETHYGAISTEMLVDLAAHPQLGPLLLSMPKELLEEQSRQGQERLRLAIRGDWEPYDANLRIQGAMYAGSGMPFTAWYDLARSLQRYVIPRIVETFISDPGRLSAALVTTQELFDGAMTVIAEAYLDAKESALRQSEERLAITLNSIGDAVIATDEAGRVVRMNPVAEHLIGCTLGEARGRPLAEVFDIRHEETDEPLESPTDRVLRKGGPAGHVNRTVLLGRGGARRAISHSGAPILGADGAIRGVVLVFRDMTGERIAQELRTRSLLLEGENARVLEASRLKSEFLATMSHELRTPLNAIIGFTELIHDGHVGTDTPEFPKFLGLVLTSAHHLLKLINDVLDLAKVEAGKFAFYPEDVEPGRIVDEVAILLEKNATAAGVTLSSWIDPGLGLVHADPQRLKQVLYNYLSNAIKFTDSGGQIYVRVAIESEEVWRLEVEDTGIGIAPHDLRALFAEFQQLDSGSTSRRPGTGLGLALSRRLVEAQGGAVGVRSELGVGSVFHATLPRRALVGGAAPLPRPLERAPSSSSTLDPSSPDLGGLDLRQTLLPKPYSELT
ncbi:MAG: ATP-binding protein [Pseudomonadota bacterium]|nr:ATP-binding protein [Pseudomonadota bacterium]